MLIGILEGHPLLSREVVPSAELVLRRSTAPPPA